MLSKRLNDIVLIGIMIVVIALVFLGRIFVLGNIDEDIASVENDILNIENAISADQALVEEYRYENVPSESQLTSRIPRNFSNDQLLYFVEAQMILSDIGLDDDRNLSIVVYENQGFSEGTRFRELSQTFLTTRIQVTFLTNDKDDITKAIDYMYDANQLFLVHGIEYREVDSEDHEFSLEVELNFLTFYIEED